ncbi:MAG TPA: hypothetical protein VKN14_03535 [Flavobacteriaceae bacterium]|nr:hypothetical protein [Flavobacteriaceae bacterium]
MLPTIPSHLYELPIYKKAIEIITLSQNLSQYFTEDLCELKPDGTEDANIYFSGDIVQQSVSLAPEILKAELEHYSDKKYKHVLSIKRLTYLLYKNCSRLERANSNGKDYIAILRRELKIFRKLQHTWALRF